MSRILSKADRLTPSDVADAPAGKWSTKIVEAVNSVADAIGQIRSPGLESRVGASVGIVSFQTTQDWYPLTMSNTDWKGVPSTTHPVPAVRKNDDGTANLVGAWLFAHSIPDKFIARLPDKSMYPDGLTPLITMNAAGTTYSRLTVSTNGGIYMESMPSVSDYFLIPGLVGWRCSDQAAPVRIPVPVFVSHGLESIADVRIVSCVDSSSPSVQLPHPRLAWIDNGDGRVKITNALGLPGGKKYTLKLLFIQG